MSRVYFHSPSGEAALHGSERAYAGRLCEDLALLALRYELEPLRGQPSLRAWLPEGCYALDYGGPPPRDFATGFRSWFGAGFDERFLTDPATGETSTPFRLSLNTAIVIGSDPIRLLARMHGQCELHGWVDGPDREWLAGIVDAGLRDAIYRQTAGWQEVAALLRSRDDEPVVMSYSVTESFPHPWVIEEAGLRTFNEDEYDDFFELPDTERWQAAMEGLRALQERSRLQLLPETFAEQGFGDGRSAFDIVRAISDAEAA